MRKNAASITIRIAARVYVVTLECVWGRATRIARSTDDLLEVIVDLMTHLPSENVYRAPVEWLGASNRG